ncbi:4,5-DOPA dioxygenase extradiol [Bradyrhizobium sp.]|uniref:4,5-DOPA-extradiol-dioxygenase n=1 Tax=Bradyrhizobium sp. TaxID=376 RepID=UPI002BDA68CE|nr:4,5-DOPA dioxygenase extradiol [Bradyrhizobium sp.]HMM88039.1 4,5-DOPA dioxygenase extradiol [Bradyrhizobium sp.]
MTAMPALFIGHGSPMNTLEDNGYTRAWRKLGKALPRPRAVLVVSAHWFIGATAVTAMARPRTIHDFYGFPNELFAFDYPAPGLPELAGEVAEVVKPHWVGADRDQWGLDHGTWSVLAHLFPNADVPVVQLSINALMPFDYHLDLATKLNQLRKRNVMIVSSGNVVHNLRRIEWDRPDTGADWAHRFDDKVEGQMSESPADILKVVEHADYDMAVPTPDHFIPLLYTAGLAAADKDARTLLRGYAMGSLSMTCYGVGVEGLVCEEPEGAATLPRGVPPDQANI